MNKRLYRSAHDRMLAGVCGGIAEYFQIDPTLVRLGWVAFTALGGSGILAYIILAVIVPSASNLCLSYKTSLSLHRVLMPLHLSS